jgi:hypothetical protein
MPDSLCFTACSTTPVINEWPDRGNMTYSHAHYSLFFSKDKFEYSLPASFCASWHFITYTVYILEKKLKVTLGIEINLKNEGWTSS